MGAVNLEFTHSEIAITAFRATAVSSSTLARRMERSLAVIFTE